VEAPQLGLESPYTQMVNNNILISYSHMLSDSLAIVDHRLQKNGSSCGEMREQKGSKKVALVLVLAQKVQYIRRHSEKSKEKKFGKRLSLT